MDKKKWPVRLPSAGKSGAKKEQKGQKSRLAFQGGAYALLLSVIVLAILIAVNVLASVLPANLTKYDISAAKLYSVTSNTKVVVNALDKDVTVYWIVQDGEEDEVIENLLQKYNSLSDHIEIVKKNPDEFPTFAEQYTDEEVPNNSLVVECGERNRYISYDDIYLQNPDMYSYTYNTSFDGEGAVTSAIDYVVREEMPQLYTLEGHGEGSLPDSFARQIEKANMEVQSLSLLKEDQVPEDAACVVIYGPQSDISEEEQHILADYVENGGKLLVMAGAVEDGMLENLHGLLSDYGVKSGPGIVVEGDQEHFAFQAPHILLPEMTSDAITESLIEANYYPIFPLSQGLTVEEDGGKGTVTTLLSTTSAAYRKTAGYNLETYEKEEGDEDGPFALAVSIESTGGGKIVWFSSSAFLEDEYNAYSSGANADLGMNAVASLVGESEAMAIRSKSLNYNYLTISESTSALLKAVLIGVFPLLYLGVGIAVVWRRRRLQNEPV